MQINRIINKFEPQTHPVFSSKKLEDDLISPGRLPRKSFKNKRIEDTDDYEDETSVSTQENQEKPNQEESNQEYALSSVFNNTSGLILEITAESTEKIQRNSPSFNLHNMLRSESSESSPISTRSSSPVTVIDTNAETMSSQRSWTPPPIMEKPATPTRSPELADDSCHPSPEVPHRTVCAVPNPDNKEEEETAVSSIIVSGGNLGGMANKGFEEGDEIPSEQQEESETDTDAGYRRVRKLDNETIESNVLNSFEMIPTQPENQACVNSLEVKNTLPILFFLHGVGGSADIWNSQLKYFLSKGYQVIAPDMIGHGFSSCPDKASAYTFTKIFKDIITIFDAYVPEGKTCVVIGHSYGCSFGAALARTRPEKIVTLIMIASGGPTPLAPPPNLSKYPRWMINFFQLALECKFRSQQHKYNPRGKTIKFKEAFDVPPYVFKHVMLGQVWPEGDAGFHRRISVPTLLVYGMRDTLVSLVEECEMERTIPKVCKSDSVCIILNNSVLSKQVFSSVRRLHGL